MKQFWRADERLKALLRDHRWTGFMRACGKHGLFFDIPGAQDSDWKARRRHEAAIVAGELPTPATGYQATAFRAEGDSRRVVARGSGSDPVTAVRSAYEAALAAGDPVEHSLGDILTREETATDIILRHGHDTVPLPTPLSAEFDVMGLIG